MNEPAVSDLRVEQAALRTLAPAVRKSFYTSILSIAIFSALLFRFSPDGTLAWLGLRFLVSAIGLIVIKRACSGQLDTNASLSLVVITLAVSGVVWGLIPLFIRPEAAEWRAIVVLWLFGNQSVITAACSSSAKAFGWAIGSVTIVGAICLALVGDSFGVVLAGMLLLGGVYSVSMFGPMHRAVRSAIEGQIRTEVLATELGQRQAELQRANNALAELASKDALTGLPNRRSFVSAVADSKGRIREQGHLGYLDCDNFKPINDTLGHAAGDAVLTEVAQRWRDVLPHDALLARMGGDEFAVYLPGFDSSRTEGVVEQLMRSLDTPVAIDGVDFVPVTVSIGTCAVLAGDEYAGAIARADAALYQMKAQRKPVNGQLKSNHQPESFHLE